MLFAAKSCLDVAIWFNDRALNDGEYLQPQKLHRLMFLAQSYYTVAYPGRKLMPGTFVTDNFGPVEPTVFHAFAFGRSPHLEANPIPDQATHFLDSIWRRFGQYSADQLNKRLADHPAVADAMNKGGNHEIAFADMIKHYQGEAAAKSGVPAAEQVVRPRVMRSQSGKPVAVKGWTPKALVKKPE
jgi:uncharacterized phage-associated protein